MSTRILTRNDVRTLLTPEAAIAAVESAFAAHGRGRTVMPAKVYIPLPEFDGDFRAMPVYMPGAGEEAAAAGLKWVNSHPHNPERHGLDAVIGVFIYSDPITAQPLAIMDATEMTALRTGAAAAVATKYLARPDSRRLGLIGCGAQANAVLSCQRLVGEFDEIVLCDRSEPAANELARVCGNDRCHTGSVAEAARCDVVCTLTPSRKPIVTRAMVAPGTHINAMGADAPGKQELEARILQDARVFLDDPAQACESGEVNIALAQRLLVRENLAGSLGEVVAGRRHGREAGDVSSITVFDSTGLAVQDLAVARIIYAAACARGVGLDIDLVG